jgi:hypothetical protein
MPQQIDNAASDVSFSELTACSLTKEQLQLTTRPGQSRSTSANFIHTSPQRTIVTYSANIWWPGVKFRTSIAELRKLQKMACLGITGAMRTALRAVYKVSYP